MNFHMVHYACFFFRIFKLYGRCLVFLTVLSEIAYLTFSTPSYLEKPCDPLNAGHVESLCESVFNGEVSVTEFASQYAWCKRSDVISDSYYQTQLPSECQRFVKQNGYLSYDISKEELNFPIAFSILMHENVEQVS